MAEFPYLPLWTDAYLADTTHLETIDHGAYLLILMAMWRSKNGRLPNNLTLLRRVSKTHPRAWPKVWVAIRDFFDVEGDFITQKRLQKELMHCQKTRECKVAAGKASALKRKNSASTDVPPLLQQNTNRASTPTPTPIKKEKERPLTGSKEKARGTRLDTNWQPGQEWFDFALTLGRDREWAEDQASRFRDYWIGKSGQGGTKLDWEATGRNWLRKANDTAGHSGGNGSQGRGQWAI